MHPFLRDLCEYSERAYQVSKGQDEGLRMLPFVQMPAAVSRCHVVHRRGPQARHICIQGVVNGVQGLMGRRHLSIVMRIRSHRPHHGGIP